MCWYSETSFLRFGFTFSFWERGGETHEGPPLTFMTQISLHSAFGNSFSTESSVPSMLVSTGILVHIDVILCICLSAQFPGQLFACDLNYLMDSKELLVFTLSSIFFFFRVFTMLVISSICFRHHIGSQKSHKTMYFIF